MHLIEIKRGCYGEWSKVQEEWEELCDAWTQDLGPLIMMELCDLVGALEGLLLTKIPEYYSCVEQIRSTYGDCAPLSELDFKDAYEALGEDLDGARVFIDAVGGYAVSRFNISLMDLSLFNEKITKTYRLS